LPLLNFSRLSKTILAFSTCLNFGVAAQQINEELKPLWEAGMFAAIFTSPEYPAANQQQSNVIAAPLIIYRGKTFRVGDGSVVRAVAIEKSWYELDVSLNASFNADSEDNVTRAGMPDLDFIFEIGPQLTIFLDEYDYAGYGKGKLSLDIQARAVMSTDFSNFNHRGFIFHPELSYQHKGIFSEKAELNLSIAPAWATERLHDYFYQIDSQFITPQRPAYDASGGYLGTDLSVSVGFKVTANLRMFVGGKVSLHSGSANSDSPLFKDNSTYSIGAGLIWRLFESEEQVAGR
jgi:outer membrane protein